MAASDKTPPSPAPPDLQHERPVEPIVEQDVDRFIHEFSRLKILVALSRAGEADYQVLAFMTKLTSGNLSVQTIKLEEAGYIAVHKRFERKTPVTSYRITPVGRAAVQAYWEYMHALQRKC